MRKRKHGLVHSGFAEFSGSTSQIHLGFGARDSSAKGEVQARRLCGCHCVSIKRNQPRRRRLRVN